MPTAGKFCTLSSPSEHFSFFYMIVLKVNPTPPHHLFLSPSSKAWELDKTVIRPVKQVAPRSSIRGFKDDYYHVDTDVVLIEGEVHVGTKPVSIAPCFRVALAHVYIIVLMLTLRLSHPSAKRVPCASRRIKHALNTQV
jgi:hypothetical protein